MHAAHPDQMQAFTHSTQIIPLRITAGRIDDERTWRRIGLLMRSALLVALVAGSSAWLLSISQPSAPGAVLQRPAPAPTTFDSSLSPRAP
ncbi:hypothetical protein [Dokdonella sp.]|uniref:hypothetical protein n=1 Tax=Dokdonella sp. TaxID=2291710 RepID=UPI0025BE893F|nr:hypothetical protein [Dokdonella sp.]MBX3688651.1 hypothetical protein [Dokdonella sp.]